jgi:hypothetical protein
VPGECLQLRVLGRVRKANEEIVRGLKVVPQQPADVLGVYVYLPQQPVSLSFGAEA